MNIWTILLIYFGAGIILITTYGAITYVHCVRKFGLDITCEAVDNVHNTYVCIGHGIVWKLMNMITGFLVWPSRFGKAPQIGELLWEECERLTKEKEQNQVSIIEEIDEA